MELKSERSKSIIVVYGESNRVEIFSNFLESNDIKTQPASKGIELSFSEGEQRLFTSRGFLMLDEMKAIIMIDPPSLEDIPVLKILENVGIKVINTVDSVLPFLDPALAKAYLTLSPETEKFRRLIYQQDFAIRLPSGVLLEEGILGQITENAHKKCIFNFNDKAVVLDIKDCPDILNLNTSKVRTIRTYRHSIEVQSIDSFFGFRSKDFPGELESLLMFLEKKLKFFSVTYFTLGESTFVLSIIPKIHFESILGDSKPLNLLKEEIDND